MALNANTPHRLTVTLPLPQGRTRLLLRDSDIPAPLLNPENLMSQSLGQQQC